MTGRLSSVVFDCSDPHRLAHFYSELLGLPVTRVDGDWVDIGDGPARLSFQHAPGHQPPRWPDPAFPQQVHLDIHVDDITAVEAKVLALGGDPAAQHRAGVPGLRRPGRSSVLPGMGVTGRARRAARAGRPPAPGRKSG
jgi:catechol 2,3-dioxygenase-like lactoylglutathione lyase family enzyme